ncbi:MAG: YvcK family protein [Acidaminococcales bacterium]|jgi:uncharacterized cofD-like protein|nr:YvcK family protein [Acidaminococcales bacterium]
MSFLKWLYPGINIKRWIVLLLLGIIFAAAGFALAFSRQLADLADAPAAGADRGNLLTGIGCAFVLAGLGCGILAVRGLLRSLTAIFLSGYDDSFIDLVFLKRRLVKGAAVTVIGGGTGLSTLLRVIKQITSNCKAVVAVTDDGGSSGRLREEFGIIPMGDLRSCITALADAEPLMSKLMQYRFKEGNHFSGHSFGNLFITAMAAIVGDMETALDATGNILKVRGSVFPATLENVRLAALMDDGELIEGETKIAAAGKKIKRLILVPERPAAAKSAVEAIMGADMLVVGPGSLYTSIITNLLIPEIKEAVLKSKAVKVYVCNVMTQPGETDGYSSYDHVKAIYDHVGEYFFDFIVVNKQEVGTELLEKYARKGAYPVKNENGMIMAMGASVIEANLISEDNLVRHEPAQLAKTLIALIYRLHLSGKGSRLLDYYFVKDSLRKLKKVLEGE